MLELIIYTLVFFLFFKLCKFFIEMSEINRLRKDIDNIYYLLAKKEISRELGKRVLDDLEKELKKYQR